MWIFNLIGAITNAAGLLFAAVMHSTLFFVANAIFLFLNLYFLMRND